jgi:hypothetical protein
MNLFTDVFMNEEEESEEGESKKRKELISFARKDCFSISLRECCPAKNSKKI